jgi:Synergist-CTERM protein sorting domain-containing protein
VWNDLTITASGSTVTIAGTPGTTGTGTFTVKGTVGGVAATSVAFTLNVTRADAPTPVDPPIGSGNELGAPSTWRKERGENYYGLRIPITEAFITRFDANDDGKLTGSELANIAATVTAPNADLEDLSWSVDGTVLYLGFDFTPEDGHARDWYSGLLLDTLTFTGSNGAVVRYIFEDGIELERVANISGGGGGCDAGVSFLALALLAPVVLTLRKKR